MSWAIEVMGTKGGVTKKVTEQLDKIAANYEGKEEAKDVLAAKERILAIVEATDLGADGTEWNAVKVTASGSHGTSAKGIIHAHMSINIVRTHIALD